jgi:hypothetical protein
MEFSDQELLTYMKLAHERDITFNQLIEEALREAIKTHAPYLTDGELDLL